jgi:hypothetical protein
VKLGKKGNFQGRARGEAIKLSGGVGTRAALHSTAQVVVFFQSEAGEKRSTVGGRRLTVGGRFGRGVRSERWEERGVWEPRWAIRVKYRRDA